MHGTGSRPWPRAFQEAGTMASGSSVRTAFSSIRRDLLLLFSFLLCIFKAQFPCPC